MDILTIFGMTVRSLRMSIGMSQEALADRACLDRTYIGGVERGERNLSLRNIDKIAAALDITLSTLFKELEKMNTEEK